MREQKIIVIALLALLLFSISVACVAAQYQTEQTTNVTISSNGTFTASESNVGVSYDIQGTPGATGTVTVDVYSGNPQATASVPSGDSLTHFIVINFNMKATDFTLATVTISYTSADVQNLQSPYAVFKYVAASNSYVKLLSTVDANAKTITVTLNSINDPLLAVGGGTKSTTSAGISGALWAVIIVIAIIVVLLAAFIVYRTRRGSSIIVLNTPDSKQSADFTPKEQPPNINAENKPQIVIPTDQKIEKQEHQPEYSATKQSTNLPQEPQPSNINAQNEPQTAAPNNPEVKPSNINAEKKPEQPHQRRREKTKKQNNT